MKTRSIAILSLMASSCASLPRMERPISIYKGSPEIEAVCRLSKPGVKAFTAPHFQAISKEEASEWIEYNIDTQTSAYCLPTKAKSFSRMVCRSAEDEGVFLRYVDSLKRKVQGSQ